MTATLDNAERRCDAKMDGAHTCGLQAGHANPKHVSRQNMALIAADCHEWARQHRPDLAARVVK